VLTAVFAQVFDYATHIWRVRREAHPHMAQLVGQRFAYTKFISNHPADICKETLQDFLDRNPATFMIHSKVHLRTNAWALLVFGVVGLNVCFCRLNGRTKPQAVSSLILGSTCCNKYRGGVWSPWVRESIRYTKQLRLDDEPIRNTLSFAFFACFF
jgi:hypothetical protein